MYTLLYFPQGGRQNVVYIITNVAFAKSILLRSVAHATTVYMYIYISIFIYKYIYICIYIFIYIHIYIWIYIDIYAYTCVYIYTYIHVYSIHNHLYSLRQIYLIKIDRTCHHCTYICMYISRITVRIRISMYVPTNIIYRYEKYLIMSYMNTCIYIHIYTYKCV
jgi:hypothetical protein